MKTKLLISFDMEEFDLPEEYGAEVPSVKKNSISADGAARILGLFEKHPEMRATFFTTAVFAKNNPALIERMVRGGHEVASHGYSHSSFSPEDLTKSRELLRSMTGQEITGFRMARLAQVGKQEILSAGYTYESSLNPVFLPGRYNNFSKPLTPFREPCGLLQIPVSALPFVRLPLFWLSFKNFPLPFYTFCAKRAASSVGFFNLYTHPWEYAEEAADPRWRIPRYITRHAGIKQLERLERLLLALGSIGEFTTFSAFAEQCGNI